MKLANISKLISLGYKSEECSYVFLYSDDTSATKLHVWVRDVKFNDTNYARLLPHLGDRGFLQPDLTTQLKARSIASAWILNKPLISAKGEPVRKC